MNIIIVAGTQRSGTTLMGQILGVHSKSFLIDESDDVFHPACEWLLDDCKTKFPDINLLQAAKKYKDSRCLIASADELQAYNLVFKAPNLSFEFEKLSLLNNVNIFTVFTVRDPRSVVSAMLRRKRSNMLKKQTEWFLKNSFFQKYHQEMLSALMNENTQNHIKAALIWKYKTQLYKKFQENKMCPLLIRYEDVISQVEDSCRKLALHCNIEYECSMKEHHLILSGKAPGNTVRNRQIDNKSLYKWEDELSEQQVFDVSEICKNGMNYFNY